MIVRKPLFNFKKSLPHWNASEPEFSQINNSASTILPHLEPYLIKVLKKAREYLKEGQDDALIQDMDLFIRQEANHFKMHDAYNQTLYENGYPELKAFENKLSDDYKVFLSDKSLKFNIAYSEGFESVGIIQAEFIFNHALKWVEGADEPVRALWEWHLAEEYEHRTVCYDIYKRLYGGYFYRIYGLFYAMIHLYGYGNRVSKYLIKKDRKTGAVKDPFKSWLRESHYRLKLNTFVLFKMFRILSPFYNPRKCKMPEAAAKRLNTIILAD